MRGIMSTRHRPRMHRARQVVAEMEIGNVAWRFARAPERRSWLFPWRRDESKIPVVAFDLVSRHASPSRTPTGTSAIYCRCGGSETSADSLRFVFEICEGLHVRVLPFTLMPLELPFRADVRRFRRRVTSSVAAVIQ